ncbi:glycosyltransferase family 2 protein [Flavobacterium sp. GT3R68]|uniref:glycosyltransferase family 2 protein n=1 Tax=Flavobacterium sp. GT3R68 TaxID=2594437 RepID=UPI000F899A7B|nr:glycosyltransferase family 2 protein [Flavobacterium sp. GT3R68]RTY92268.1 glycosyltransferase family 2 protein [Flavobacterium sp. GSN2]TRW92504.1 glycosyltransferase family 2 protein [Flavobacterium sp. GT3R68]
MITVPTKVTIITATYNRAHYILESLLSIQAQTFLDWECLIIDDGGTDNTLEVITPILEHDRRFKFLKRPEKYRKGLPGCRNYGLDLAKGNFIIFFDDDDFVHPDNLKTCLDVFTVNDIDFCHYQKTGFEEDRPQIGTSAITKQQAFTIKDIDEIVTQQIGLASCTVMWKKHCFEQHRFNENLFYAEEWECYIRLISDNLRGVIIDTVLYYNRKHANSNTGEFFRNNPVRKASKKDAILFVFQNLNKKQLLSPSLMRYFIQQSLAFKEYNLFEQILNQLQLPVFEKLKWQIFFVTLPLRLSAFRKWKKIKNT